MKSNRYIKCFLSFLLSLSIFFISATAWTEPSLQPCKEQFSPTLCSKIGQMLIVGFGGLKQDEHGTILWQDPDGTDFSENSRIAKAIREQQIGGVILFNRPFFNQKTGNFIRNRNIKNPEQVQKLNEDLQNYSSKMRTEKKLPELPLLISIDQEGGMVDRLPYISNFPLKTMIPQAFGTNEEIVFKNPEKKKEALKQTFDYAKQMASELADNHFNVNFFPSVDVNINPLNFVISGRGRSFSHYPEIVTDQAQEFIRAFHEKQLLATLKHFPGHGSSTSDTHDGLVDVTKTYQKDIELLPYQILIKNGFQDMIMTAHVINGNLDKSQCKPGNPEDQTTWCPGTMSYATITRLLRNQLGFKGVVVSDDFTMGAIANEYPLEIALEKALNAGVDMFIISNNTEDDTEKLVNTFAKLLKEGKIKEEQIDRANQNIINMKKRLVAKSSLPIKAR